MRANALACESCVSGKLMIDIIRNLHAGQHTSTRKRLHMHRRSHRHRQPFAGKTVLQYMNMLNM